MKKFMAVYIGTTAGRERWNRLSATERQAAEAQGLQAWHDWMARHAAVVVDAGGPLGKTKRTSPQGVADTTNAMTGYVIVQADSHQAAATLFEQHPHFTIFPGDAVEIMECLPIPGQA